ncbi:MAG TPA: 1,2-phenylacetyl-CoA epoxidase subunit PaaE [Ferruginibacter sp.]|nr:1,2-phenylacetyl-CoA epoxidase subunit PaaE [Ferruginibacter sp.]
MAVHFHPLKIKSISRETPECVSIEFEIPSGIASIFTFKEGQNITIRKKIGDNEIRRSYSICTAPHEERLRVAIKKVDGGLFSQFANDELQPGMTLEVLPPTGNFYARLNEEAQADYLAIAAGSGITPVISIIKHTLFTQPGSRFTLVFGNRSRSSIIFFDELEALKNRYMQRFNLVNILSREKTDADLNYGRIDKQKLSSLSRVLSFKNFKSIYLCGPEEMIFASSAYFGQLGINKQSIHFELFTIPGQASSQKVAVKEEEKESGPESKISIKLDGRTFDFGLSYKGQSILDRALQTGADLPYACKGGVCCSCRAKLIEGKVEMDVNYALEPDEVKAGYILACQSHPRSEKIVIDFDIK